ncbi:MAG: hypothetical protein WCE75_14040, partial [Terracidiphilus sp.]
MRKTNPVHAMLAEGRCTMTKGRAFDAAVLVLEEPRRMRQLVECLFDPDPGVAGRAADALETVVLESPRLLAPWKDTLLALLLEAGPIRLRWHLAL